MSEGIYTEAPLALRAWLSAIVKDAVVYADHARRFTLTVNDIILALREMVPRCTVTRTMRSARG